MSAAIVPLKRSRATGIGRLDELVGYALRRAQLRMYGDLVRSLEPLGLRPVTLSVLCVIDSNPGMSQVAVGDAIAIHRANFVSIAEELIKRGWIQRSTSKADRRQYSLSLSRAGAEVLKAALKVVGAHEERLLAGLSVAERKRLKRMLENMLPDED